MNQTAQTPYGVSAPAEAKQIDFIACFIVEGQEAVSIFDVGINPPAKRTPRQFVIPLRSQALFVEDSVERYCHWRLVLLPEPA